MENNGWNELGELLSHQHLINNLTLIDSQKIPEDLKLMLMKPGLKINTMNFLFLKSMNYIKFIDFLMVFKDSVNFLSIIRVESNENSQNLFKAVVRNFSSLHGLAVDFDQFPTEGSFYSGMEVNTRLKNMALNSKLLNNPDGLRGIVRVYPAVEQLSLSITRIGSLMQAGDFENMFANLKQLKTFFLVMASAEYLKYGYFKNITSLNLVDCPEVVDWAKIAEKNPNLKTLIISRISNSPNNLINYKNILVNLRNLKHLELGIGFSVTQAQIKMIKKKAPGLKILKILKSSWKIKAEPSEILRKHDIKNLQIILQSKSYENVSHYSNTFFFKCV